MTTAITRAIVPDAAPAGGVVLDGSPLPVFWTGQMVERSRLPRVANRARSRDARSDHAAGRPRVSEKGYWRAVAVAFNLRLEAIEERRDVSGAFDDGHENFGYTIVYRATAPNGRHATGDGACFAIEKARRFRCRTRTRPGPVRRCTFRPPAARRLMRGSSGGRCRAKRPSTTSDRTRIPARSIAPCRNWSGSAKSRPRKSIAIAIVARSCRAIGTARRARTRPRPRRATRQRARSKPRPSCVRDVRQRPTSTGGVNTAFTQATVNGTDVQARPG